MENLFEPGGNLHGSKMSTGLQMTEAQRLRAALNEKKSEVLTGENVQVDLDRSVLHTEGQTYLLPVAFTQALREGRIKRSGAIPQAPLELIDGPLEFKAQNWEAMTQPIYWLHITDSDEHIAYPVYGYAGDYGLGYHPTPVVKDQTGWDEAAWLCRCSQCGRELPPSYYFKNTNGRLKSVCKACQSSSRTVDRIFKKDIMYRSDEETQLLISVRHWYEGLWKRNLCPRGTYAEHCIGKKDIEERLRKTTRHKRGSAPRRPQGTASRSIKRIVDLIEETSKN